MYFIKYIAGIGTFRKKFDGITLLTRAFDEITDIKIKLIMGCFWGRSVVHVFYIRFPFINFQAGCRATVL